MSDIRFHLRGGTTIDVRDDTIEDIGDVYDKLLGGPQHVQFGDAIVYNHAVNAAELL